MYPERFMIAAGLRMRVVAVNSRFFMINHCLSVKIPASKFISISKNWFN